MAELLLVIMVIYVTMVYGPIAAFLVELFPILARAVGAKITGLDGGPVAALPTCPLPGDGASGGRCLSSATPGSGLGGSARLRRLGPARPRPAP
jgi:hypothetical protein